MFSFLKQEKVLAPVVCEANEVVSMAKGKIIDIAKVSDAMFAEKMLGESIAFDFDGSDVVLCAPCNGELTAVFPTGHAFGLTMENGVEVLVHIGVNTVSAGGEGFQMLAAQGDKLKAGDPVVKVNFKSLKKKYDMSTMLIITDDNGHTVEFEGQKNVDRGDIVGRC